MIFLFSSLLAKCHEMRIYVCSRQNFHLFSGNKQTTANEWCQQRGNEWKQTISNAIHVHNKL